MADFFTRLAERALGVAPMAAPDLPPMFAPAAQPMELSTEIIAPRPSVRAENAQAKTSPQTASLENPPLRPAEPAREALRRSDEIRSPLVKVPLAANQTGDTDFPIHRGEEVSQAAVQSASESSFDAAASIARDATERMARNEAVPPTTMRAPLSDAPVASTIRAEPATPTIHVTIGRVEVRAVTMPAEPARPRERKAPPLLSLDQYLRQRNEGRR